MGNAIATLRLGDHVGLPFSSDRERLSAMAAFAAAGLRGRYKVLVLTTVEDPSTLHARLAERVARYRPAAAAGQVEIVPGEAVYLADGRFDGDRMLEVFAETMDQTEQQGYAGLWVSADTTWAADGSHNASLTAYETDINALFTSGRMAAVCQYDRRLFDAGTLAEVCSAHPIIANGAAFRFAPMEDPPGLVLTGELDGTNRRAFAAVLAPLANVPAPLLIDAGGVIHSGVEATAMLARLAVLRGGYPTTIICRPQLRRLLHLVDTTRALRVRGPNGEAPYV